MKTDIAYIGEKPAANNHAGNKARTDIDTLLRERYGEPYERLEEIVFTSFFQKVKYLLNPANWEQIIRIYRLSSRNVIMQYPFYFNPILRKALWNAIKRNRVVFLIHDVNTLRCFKDKDVQEEIDELNMAKAVVVHNDKMGNALQKLGLTAPWISLGLFDYLLPACPQKQLTKGKTVAFAGNLGKSKFLRNPDMQKLDIRFNLYGPGFDRQSIKWNNVHYKGSYLPNEIPYKLEGNFGLIWDGTEIQTCDGSTGVYMQYNNPHKLSLYIAAGLPVIVWNKAAIADFVRRHGIGITVGSLEEVSEKIEKLTDSEYAGMTKNTHIIQKQIVDGGYSKRCLGVIESKIFTNS